MHNFLLDLWHDLRAKRLWPIAVTLVVGIAAVPVVLLKKESPATPPPATAQVQPAVDKVPSVTLDTAALQKPSDLAAFSQKNPFKPLKDLPKKAPAVTGSSSGGSSSSSGSGGSSSSSGSSGSSGGSSSSGSRSTSGGGTKAPTTTTSTTYYAYRADIKFGAPGKEKTVKQVPAFSLLGDAKSPPAMFMGITDDHKSAVFALDVATYTATGEHECKPSAGNCEFIYLSVDEAHNETVFSSIDGTTTYNLKLLSIKRVILDPKSVTNVPTAPAQKQEASAKGTGTMAVLRKSLFDVLSQTLAQTR
jgi:hypothetical protein